MRTVATVIGAEPLDLARKIEKAKQLDGPRLIIALAPCPTGWDYDPRESIDVGKLAEAVDEEKAVESVDQEKLKESIDGTDIDVQKAVDSVDKQKAAESVDMEKVKEALGSDAAKAAEKEVN